MYNQTYVWIGTLNPFVMLLFSVVILLITFMPSYIAFTRNHPNRMAILVFNILLGWTGIGWLILLIWAFSDSRKNIANEQF